MLNEQSYDLNSPSSGVHKEIDPVGIELIVWTLANAQPFPHYVNVLRRDGGVHKHAVDRSECKQFSHDRRVTTAGSHLNRVVPSPADLVEVICLVDVRPRSNRLPDGIDVTLRCCRK